MAGAERFPSAALGGEPLAAIRVCDLSRFLAGPFCTMLLADYGKHVLLPEEKFKDFARPEPFIPDSPGHHREWLDACRNRTPTGSPFDYAAALTEANHLGNVAYRSGGRIEWDRENMRIPNRPEAERFLRRQDPRPGWELA